jgi:hypothetical protein
MAQTIALAPIYLASSLRPVMALVVAAIAAALVVAILMAANVFLERWSGSPPPVEDDDTPQTVIAAQSGRRRFGCWTCLTVSVLSLLLLYGWFRVANYHTGWVPVRFIGYCDRDIGPLKRSPDHDYEAWIVFEHCSSIAPGGSKSYTEVRLDESDPGLWDQLEWRANRGDHVFRIRDHMRLVGRHLETDVQLKWVSDRELTISCEECSSEIPDVQQWRDVVITTSN